MFDEALRARDSQCCVCLGEFEMKEQLHQIPTCNHIFHIECIHNWLHANTTCPLCRCSIVSSSTTNHPHSNNEDHQSPSISINSSSSSSLGPNLNQLEPSDHDHFHDDRVLSEV
ncbi:hypothetical protein Scep_025434 [Stephania cephalantha]|uniref:RING-type E3 ubiquitin transferase n=1 Tax=Stephania cephalantha TaxID=152367 RepID=A0AAP0EKR7_9MAGN